MCRGSSVITTDPQSRYGGGMGGHSGRRALDYQVSWREQVERAQDASKSKAPTIKNANKTCVARTVVRE